MTQRYRIMWFLLFLTWKCRVGNAVGQVSHIATALKRRAMNTIERVSGNGAMCSVVLMPREDQPDTV